MLTGGVVVGDLSADGVPEVVFTSYSPDEGKSALYVLDASGKQLHRIALPKRGAMPVPTLADVDGDGTVDIVVSLKDAEDKVESVQVYRVPGSAMNCLPWPTGRGNLLRSGLVPAQGLEHRVVSLAPMQHQQRRTRPRHRECGTRAVRLDEAQGLRMGGGLVEQVEAEFDLHAAGFAQTVTWPGACRGLRRIRRPGSNRHSSRCCADG